MRLSGRPDIRRLASKSRDPHRIFNRARSPTWSGEQLVAILDWRYRLILGAFLKYSSQHSDEIAEVTQISNVRLRRYLGTTNSSLVCLSVAHKQWRSHGGTGGTRPPTCPKDRLWDSPDPMRSW